MGYSEPIPPTGLEESGTVAVGSKESIKVFGLISGNEYLTDKKSAESLLPKHSVSCNEKF